MKKSEGNLVSDTIFHHNGGNTFMPVKPIKLVNSLDKRRSCLRLLRKDSR
jgi:hypothetical protein